MVRVKGYEVEVPVFRDSFDRRAVQIENRIIATLKRLGTDRDDAEVDMQRNARLGGGASVSWWFEGRNLRYGFSGCLKFIENLFVVDAVLNLEVEKLVEREVTLEQFQNEFFEEKNIGGKLRDAKKLLGVDENEADFDLISRKYKALARKFHPDMEDGNHDVFQKINAAHKLIGKELN